MSTCAAINTIYDERKDFIIIGLTGRTGSGCSTVAQILMSTKFDDLDLRTPKSHSFNDAEDIKYSKLHSYMSANNMDACNWSSFEVISMSDIIVSFIIENGYEKFVLFLKNEFFEPGFCVNREQIVNVIADLKDLLNETQKKMNGIKDYEDISKNAQNIYDCYMDKNGIRELSNTLKTKLLGFNCTVNDKESQLYTALFQKIGNNLRASGKPYDSNFDSRHFFTLSERTNSVIKSIRHLNKNSVPKKSTLICIDAIRNPFEATFFKDRYSAFYLMSVNTDDVDRRRRLSDLRADEIESLDEREYPKKLSGEAVFYRQNISACLEIADIHLYNPDIKEGKYYFLTEQLLKYVALVIHPGLVTPTNIERCMQVAYNAKLNSGCLSRQVGAVVTDSDFSIKALGWNEVAKGQASCSLRDLKEFLDNKDRESYSEYEVTNSDFYKAMKELDSEINYEVLGGRKHPYCFKDCYNKLEGKDNQVHTRALHAEENAFLQISKYGGAGVAGGFLFTTASPCELCAKKAYQLGISRIYYIDPYPGISSSHILNFGSKGNPKTHLFYGAIGNAYISLYTPRISYKDELELITKKSPKDVITPRSKFDEKS